MARFPYISSQAKQAAYDKHVECYLKLAKSFDPPLEVVRIPFEGKEIIGYMRVPHVQLPEALQRRIRCMEKRRRLYNRADVG